MRYLASVKWILISFVFTSANVSGQIDWNSENRINWNDFKGQSADTTKVKAVTATYFKSEYGVNDTCYFYSVRNLFDKQRSWHVDSSVELLEHERGHFDISEIYAREMRKFLKTNLATGSDDSTIRSRLTELIQQSLNYQKLYDRETNFSLNQEKQSQWTCKIRNQLNKLSAFKDSEYDHCPSVDSDGETLKE